MTFRKRIVTCQTDTCWINILGGGGVKLSWAIYIYQLQQHEELWTRETLSVRKGFNLGNFGTGHGKRCQFGKSSIWEIFASW